MKVIIAGGSGLVGRHLIPLLSRHEVTLLTRRRLPDDLHQLHAEIEECGDAVARHHYDVAISTLGTTIKQAGSRQAFAAVDRDLVADFARGARMTARQMIAVSSVGANAKAANFYLRIKGAVESELRALSFERLDIMRPGLLRGKRSGPPRSGERAMIALSPLTDRLTRWSLDRYRSISAEDVAKAIAALVGHPELGVHIHHNREMLKLARQPRVPGAG